MRWDLLIDKEEMIYVGIYALFCFSCWSIIAIMFWTLYGILSLFDFINRKVTDFIERRFKHGRSKDCSELDG